MRANLDRVSLETWEICKLWSCDEIRGGSRVRSKQAWMLHQLKYYAIAFWIFALHLQTRIPLHDCSKAWEFWVVRHDFFFVRVLGVWSCCCFLSFNWQNWQPTTAACYVRQHTRIAPTNLANTSQFSSTIHQNVRHAQNQDSNSQKIDKYGQSPLSFTLNPLCAFYNKSDWVTYVNSHFF